MKYTNTTSTGMYVKVPGLGHQFISSGAEVEISCTVNVPGLTPTITRTAKPKKVKPKPIVNIDVKEPKKDDVRTRD